MQSRKKRSGREIYYLLFILVLIMVTFLLIAFTLVKKDSSNNQNNPESVNLNYRTEAIGEEPSAGSEISEAPASETEEKAENGIPEGYVISNDQVWTTTNVNFRMVPDTGSEVLAVVARRSEVTRIAFSEEWALVTYEGQNGYISQEYLTMDEPQDNGHIVVIDAGHQSKGNSDKEPNAPGSSTMKAKVTGGTRGTTTGVYEYELNLDIALQLQAELENRGYVVYMTRTTHDVNISNVERAQYAQSVGGEIFIRIHANGADSSSTSGALALAPSLSNPYVSGIAEESRRLSKCVLDKYCSVTGMSNQGVISSDTMTGINWCTMPVTILEMGYMTNSSDDTNMQDHSYQAKMVQGIADGVDEYFEN